MSASKNKGPSEGTMGLTISEARLLLLGLVCEVGGKVSPSKTNPVYPQMTNILIGRLQSAGPEGRHHDLQRPYHVPQGQEEADPASGRQRVRG